MLYFIAYIRSARSEQTVQTLMRRRKRGIPSGSTMFATIQLFLDTTMGSKLYFVQSLDYVW